MAHTNCGCGHEMKDHVRPQRLGSGNYGECKICLCEAYTKPKPTPIYNSPAISEYSILKSDAPVIDWVLEQIERKNCPQGLNVIAEELKWMGQTSLTHDKLQHAVSVELRKPHPRIQSVAEGVYWFAGKNVPVGWSLYGDRRMLPCFYRQYPPDISWEECDRPDNILPPPRKSTNH